MSNKTKLVRPVPDLEYSADLAILGGILRDRGYDASYHDIQWAWKSFSRSRKCNWHAVPLDDDAFCFSVLRRKLVEA